MDRRTALFIDFDNVFSALCAWAPEAAEVFVMRPELWLDWIVRRPTRLSASGTPCRILIRRCYLNPNGSLLLRSGERVYFGSFRASFVQAGFQVVDCPPLTRGGKTSADIVMVMDILDALEHATHFDEFAIISSDADFTPVLQRLRSHDRRTLVVSIGSAAGAYRASADQVIGADEFLKDALGLTSRGDDERPARATGQTAPQNGVSELLALTGTEAALDSDPASAREAILAAVTEELADADRPLHLPILGKRLHNRLGTVVRSSAFGGAGSLARLLDSAGDPRIELLPGGGGGWARDPTRHRLPPTDEEPRAAERK